MLTTCSLWDQWRIGRKPRSRRRYFPLAALWLSVAGLQAQPAPPTVVAIVDTTVLPMTAAAPQLRNHTVVVTGDRIASIGPAARAAIPAGAQRIDGRGKFVMPGLADMHVHLEYFDEPAILGLFVANGVTTVRNMDGRPVILDWARQALSGALRAPRIYTAGPVLDGSPPVRDDNTVVATAAAARVAVDAQAVAGYHFIKVYSALSPDAYRSIVAAANARKLPVAGHVPRAVGLDEVLASGIASIEHLGDYASAIESDTSPFKGKGHWSKRYLSAPVDAARLRSLAERLAGAGVWTVPTLIQPLRELARSEDIAARLSSPEVQYIPAEGRAQWRETATRVAGRMDEDDWKLVAAAAQHRLQVVADFRATGVRILAGTDTPNPFVVPGFSLHDELQLLVQAGLSPGQALAASTRDAAQFMRATDWGTIEEGKVADLVLLNANPLEDVSATRRIDGVMLRGRWLSADDRAARLAAIAGTAR